MLALQKVSIMVQNINYPLNICLLKLEHAQLIIVVESMLLGVEEVSILQCWVFFGVVGLRLFDIFYTREPLRSKHFFRIPSS